MTATNLFTARDNSTARLKTGSQIAGVTVTVKEAESHTYTATLTKLALESGASVTDHMILEPETVAVSFSVTNAGQGKQNAKDAFEAFVTMQRSRKLVELVTEHAIYTDMALVNLTPLHQAPYSGALTCTATFQKVHFVELVSAGRAPSQLAKGVEKTAAGQTQSGKVEPVKVNETGLEKLRRRAADWMGKTDG